MFLVVVVGAAAVVMSSSVGSMGRLKCIATVSCRCRRLCSIVI